MNDLNNNINDINDIQKYEIPQEIKDLLESEIPENTPFIRPDKKFWVRACFVPLVIVLIIYFNFFGQPEYLQDTTWLLKCSTSGVEGTYCMLWDFDKSGELRIVHVLDGGYTENIRKYRLAGAGDIDVIKKSGWFRFLGNRLNISKNEGGSFYMKLSTKSDDYYCYGYPLKTRYPKDGSEYEKLNYIADALLEFYRDDEIIIVPKSQPFELK